MSSKQYPLPLPHREAMDVDDFMVTDSNREAMAWIQQWPDWSAHCVVIYGPSGSGKSHLRNVWLTRSHGEAVSLDKLTQQDAGTLVAANKIRALDDAEKIAGHAAKEEALFHLYNLSRESKGFLLLTAFTAPAQWNIQLPDLRSRLLSVPAIMLAAPDDELLTALLIKQFRDRQIDIGMDVITYLLPRMERNAAAIREMVTRLDHASLAEGRGITIALARRVMEDQPFLIS